MLLPTGRLHDLLPVSCVVVLSLFSTSLSPPGNRWQTGLNSLPFFRGVTN